MNNLIQYNKDYFTNGVFMELELLDVFNSEFLKAIIAYSNCKDGSIEFNLPYVNNVVKSKNYFDVDYIKCFINEYVLPNPIIKIYTKEMEDYKYIKIEVKKGNNPPYFFSYANNLYFYVLENGVVAEKQLNHSMEYIKNKKGITYTDYLTKPSNFNYFIEKYKSVNKITVTPEEMHFVKDKKVSKAGLYFSECIDNDIVVICRRYKGKFIHSRIRRAVYEDVYEGEIISIIDRIEKFLYENTCSQYIKGKLFPIKRPDYVIDGIMKIMIETIIDYHFVKRIRDEIILDIYDDRIIIIGPLNKRMDVDRKIIISCLFQTKMININKYYEDTNKLIVSGENYEKKKTKDLFEDIREENLRMVTIYNYNYKYLHVLPKELSSSENVDTFLDYKVLNMIRENCESTVPFMSYTFRVTKGAIRKIIRRLIENENIEQVGNGYFKIL